MARVWSQQTDKNTQQGGDQSFSQQNKFHRTESIIHAKNKAYI